MGYMFVIKRHNENNSFSSIGTELDVTVAETKAKDLSKENPGYIYSVDMKAFCCGVEILSDISRSL